jgi:hypothetical protein
MWNKVTSPAVEEKESHGEDSRAERETEKECVLGLAMVFNLSGCILGFQSKEPTTHFFYMYFSTPTPAHSRILPTGCCTSNIWLNEPICE